MFVNLCVLLLYRLKKIWNLEGLVMRLLLCTLCIAKVYKDAGITFRAT